MCGRNIPMAQHFLDRVDVRAVFEQMSGKGMAKRVRRNILFNPGLFLIVFDDLPESLAGHPFAADIDKQRLLIRHKDHLRANQRDIIAQRFDSGRIHGDE